MVFRTRALLLMLVLLAVLARGGAKEDEKKASFMQRVKDNKAAKAGATGGGGKPKPSAKGGKKKMPVAEAAKRVDKKTFAKMLKADAFSDAPKPKREKGFNPFKGKDARKTLDAKVQAAQEKRTAKANPAGANANTLKSSMNKEQIERLVAKGKAAMVKAAMNPGGLEAANKEAREKRDEREAPRGGGGGAKKGPGPGGRAKKATAAFENACATVTKKNFEQYLKRGAFDVPKWGLPDKLSKEQLDKLKARAGIGAGAVAWAGAGQ